MLGLLASTAIGQAQQTRIIGSLTGIGADSMNVTLINSSFDKEEKMDRIAINKTDGTFEYVLDIAETRQVLLYPALKEGQEFKGYIDMLVLPGTEARITGTLDNYQMAGAQFYNDCNSILAAKRPYRERMDALNSEFRQGQLKGQNRDSLRQAIMPRYEAVQNELAAFALGYIKEHPTQDAAATLLSATSDPAAAYAAIADNVKQGVLSGYLSNIKRMIDEEVKRQSATQLSAEGKPAPDFTLTDIKGNPLSLSSLRGKYVVLDFWGSWCIWCIRGVPRMKEYYAKYAGKFEILGIDCNDTEAKWKNAVQKYELPWLHVYNPRTSDVLTNYAVEGFPTKIVIDPQGNIIKRVAGEDDSFYEYLDGLFK